MADDLDVEAMLEAPYKKEDEGGKTHESSSKEKDRDRDKKKRSRSKERSSRDRHGDRHKKSDRKRSRSRDRDRRTGSSRGRNRSRSPDKRHGESRGSDRSGKRSGSKEKGIRSRRSRERSRERRRRKGAKSMSRSPVRNPEPQLTPEERDARTVFCMQLSARIRPRDMEEFFSSVGKVRDVRLITDNKTRRSKGIAYVEFSDTASVPLAMGLAGQKLLGVPIIVQSSQAEKNRLASQTAEAAKNAAGPMRLYVGSLHFNISEEMLKGIFEPFGKIDEIKLIRNHETSRSQGYGFLSFHNADDAKKALEQLNGFELAGRPMKVGHVTERTLDGSGNAMLDTDEMDRAGIDLGATGRLQLMAKLAEGTGFQIPEGAANTLSLAQTQLQQQQQIAPAIATQCFMLSNMFDPNTETSVSWENEIKDDVIDECNKHGGVLHIYVDKASPQGNVYVKCPSIAAASASVGALHGRWFAGNVITAAYVPLPNYHALFPDAIKSPDQLLLPSSAAALYGAAPPPQAPSALPAGITFQ